MNKQKLYEARWWVLLNMPEGAAKKALLATMRPILGPEPIWYSPGGDDAPIELPDIEEPDTGGPDQPKGIRIAWVVGHNAAAPGAWLKPPISESEFVFYNKVVDRILDRGIAFIEMRKFNRVANPKGYNAEIAACYAEVNRWKPHFVFELHFNGGAGNYSVMLYAKGSTKGQEIATITQREAVAIFPFVSDKGTWARTKSERGGASLFAAEAPCQITEPFFGDNVEHAKKIAEGGAHDYVAEWLINSAKAVVKEAYDQPHQQAA